MAVVWAKSNGNWTDTTLWAFWNETTQQIEDYNQLPQIDDVVYCNGKTISLADTSLVIKELHNDLNPYTQNDGGDVSRGVSGVTITLNCDLFGNGYATIFSGAANNTPLVINGNITNAPIGAGTNNASITINGNLTNRCFASFHSGSSRTITINGNISIEENHTLISPNSANSVTYTFIVTGVFRQLGKMCDTAAPNHPMTLTGKWIVGGGVTWKNSMTFNGVLDVTRNNNFLPIQAGSTFTFGSAGNSSVAPLEGDYPDETDVKKDVPYAYGQMVGQYTPDYPPESVVLKDYEYGDSDDRKTGTMVQEVNVEVGCVTKEDVREGVALIGMYEDEQQVVGTLVVPSVDDVREGVIFDNGSVGTLIVQGGGDRLRVADFGYYTNAQSDTYIVDLTEQDKPKFAVAEERVLIEMFPDLDLENIPDKYFDDLFVKYLKYRLIVEYYRTAGINSTFTPSEPTTEIVNYQNVRNEVWLNSANIYLKAWAKKYPESIVKPQRILL